MATGTRATAVPVYVGQLVQFGSITNSVPFFDMELPDGYSRFQFYLSGATTSVIAGDNLAAALYLSGRFANDPINNDTYANITAATVSPLITITPPQADVASSPGFRGGCLVDVYPGAIDDFPLVIVNYSWGGTGAGPTFLGQAIWTLSGVSVIPRPDPPATRMRVTPLGLGNINPPTSGETINTGNWRLYAYN